MLCIQNLFYLAKCTVNLTQVSCENRSIKIHQEISNRNRREALHIKPNERHNSHISHSCCQTRYHPSFRIIRLFTKMFNFVLCANRQFASAFVPSAYPSLRLNLTRFGIRRELRMVYLFSVTFLIWAMKIVAFGAI